jgi:hypothetical protein
MSDDFKEYLIDPADLVPETETLASVALSRDFYQQEMLKAQAHNAVLRERLCNLNVSLNRQLKRMRDSMLDKVIANFKAEFETRYHVGDRVRVQLPEKTTKRCPTCHGNKTIEVNVTTGQEWEIPCQDCGATGLVDTSVDRAWDCQITAIKQVQIIRENSVEIESFYLVFRYFNEEALAISTDNIIKKY